MKYIGLNLSRIKVLCNWALDCRYFAWNS